ncbi:MAG: DUF262 domain-containing protein [Muribaculaceae bacterium]|nr:DUF262 domain-containing protein [Muribaculaceae bacterium]
MTVYNLSTLLHRPYQWTMTLPSGEVCSGTSKRDIVVRIPRIQRDYAEGRETEMIERKRHNLLNDMLDVVYGIREELSFDFVYGYTMGSNGEVISDDSWKDEKKHPNVYFEPLDGQQRLTTLFLFYWLFGKGDLISSNNHSLFIYETRDTSEEFCNWLVNQDAVKIIKEWEASVAKILQQNDENRKKWNIEKNSSGVVDPYTNRLRFPLFPTPSLFEYMQSLATFKWDWHDDPNIHSMITVIESAFRYIHERGLSYDEGIKKNDNLDKITFMLLDKLVCDGDQLFEKMNARGKALTSFEILKSSLEEEMERQGLPHTDSQLTNNWRDNMDGDWIDFCWDTSKISIDPKLNDVRKVEEKLERLIIRMVGKSFFRTEICGSHPTNVDAVDYTEKFKTSISSRESVNYVLERYLEFAQHERAIKNQDFSQIDFQSILNDIQNLIFTDSSGWRDASTLLPKLNRSNDNTLLDEFLADAPTHNIRVMIYAMLEYLRIVPAKDIAVNSTEKSNFKDWMRFIRNVYNPDNKNSRLDNFKDVQDAIMAIENWLTEYKTNYKTSERQSVQKLILNYIKNNPLKQEQARLDEEAIKADLRLNGNSSASALEWEQSISKAEENFYLWGQIIAPLSWSMEGNRYDKKKFDTYVYYLNKMFDGTMHDNDNIDALLIQTMLCYDDYRHNLNNNLGSLGQLNNHRDHSWKQYLRKKDISTNFYGVLFKLLIDNWQEKPSLSLEELLKQEIATNKGKYSINDWQYYIVNISSPERLLQMFWDTRTSGRYILTEPGSHVYLFRSNTFRTSIRYELLTLYLSYETSLYQEGVTSPEHGHTAHEYGAFVDFKKPNGDIVRLTATDGNLYKIEEKPADKTDMTLIHQDIAVSEVETELKALGVINHL